MSVFPYNREQLEGVIREHGEIIDKIKEIVDWWSQLDELGSPKYGEMGMHAKELREILVKHYQDEEEKCYFELIRNEFPEIENAHHDFEKEHKLLLAKLDEVIACLCVPEPKLHNWREAMKLFEEFLKPFHEHEMKETQILKKVLSTKSEVY